MTGYPPLAYASDFNQVSDNNGKLSTSVELSVSCRNLQDADVFSKSDPMCVLYTQDSGSDEFREFGRTEVIQDCLNPDFTHKFVLQYRFEEQQRLKFEIYDIDSDSTDLKDHDFLGWQICTLGEIVAYQKRQLAKTLIGPCKSRNYGTLLLVAEEIRMCKNFASFQFIGKKLSKHSIFFKPDPFLLILRQNTDNSFSVVHKTQTVKGTCNPSWKIKISLSQLCNGIYDRPLKFQCYDWSRFGSHHLIGEFTTDFHKLSLGPGSENIYECVNYQKKSKSLTYNNSGQVELTFFNLEERHSFLDYIKGGTQINCTFAIDFTASNGDPKLPSSLHYLGGSIPNQYATAIRAVGEIIEDYDSDKQFPALGFGARLPPDGRVSHEFFLNGDPTNPFCCGIEGILEAYHKCINTVQLYGPTNFSPIIRHVTRFAEVYRDGSHYFILLIVTDGIITDMADTVEAIVNASVLPLSIIIIGVGNADFTAMDHLDADDSPLCSNGKYAARDIVQFVPFREFWYGSNWKKSKAALADAVLAEIPDQFMSFMKTNNIEPKVCISSDDGANIPSSIQNIERQLLHMSSLV